MPPSAYLWTALSPLEDNPVAKSSTKQDIPTYWILKIISCNPAGSVSSMQSDFQDILGDSFPFNESLLSSWSEKSAIDTCCLAIPTLSIYEEAINFLSHAENNYSSNQYLQWY